MKYVLLALLVNTPASCSSDSSEENSELQFSKCFSDYLFSVLNSLSFLSCPDFNNVQNCIFSEVRC